MATRIAFSTHYPDRMGELAGRNTYFMAKIWAGLEYKNQIHKDHDFNTYKTDVFKRTGLLSVRYEPFENNPKTTTIRSNYEYWKSKEGQLVQPFFWAGKPRRNNHVVFCPEVRLKRVSFIRVLYMEGKNVYLGGKEGDEMPFYIDDQITGDTYGDDDMNQFILNEGFDHPDHFWMWFDKDFDGALLELESVGDDRL